MNTISAFAMAAASENNTRRVFDWDKAATMIRVRKPKLVGAGLRDDWGWTGGTIYKDGRPDTTSYVYLGSTWAIPEIDIDGDVSECWRWEKDDENVEVSDKWPASALAILNGAE